MRPLILYIDRYHIGDLLFLQALARSLAARPSVYPLLLCHGTGDEVAGAFEAEGRFPLVDKGRVMVDSAVDIALLLRASTELSRRIAAMLTDSVVSSVALSGADRGLLATGEGEEVRVGRVEWMLELLERGVVPVLSLLARDSEAGGAVDRTGWRALLSLHDALDSAGIAMFSREQSASVEAHAGEPDARTSGLVESEYAIELALRGVPILAASMEAVRTRSPGSWDVVHPGDASEPPKRA